MQEILNRYYYTGKGTILGGVRIPDRDRIRRLIDPADIRPVSVFLRVSGSTTTPVVRDIDPERELRPCSGFSHQECETGYALMDTAEQNSCSIIKKSGDLSCAEE